MVSKTWRQRRRERVLNITLRLKRSLKIQNYTLKIGKPKKQCRF